MQESSDGPRACPIARTLEVVGERWSLLVIREITLGVHRFEGIRAGTGAPRAVLVERLRALERAGVLERQPYQEAGARSRHEYRLTSSGRDLAPVLLALRRWGERHAAPTRPPAADRGAASG
ncbi:transcriptional regulator [Frankia sp. CcI156]|jgi:DNA-binding HxlR family transcriptional regulator|uniref:Transcriptional regulator n=2 Tax=Frankia casuarinae (strain DSM 45818 / CECT 9043 / HFP020203 / CcI3) TaxID=106370 RepID=Q2JET3_FRACC|nr:MULTISPECIES: helix-turn-helix domain-containing protein [Frankia]ABD10209.1 putative transcriptional regulator [Frankia casuarinae]ETA01607.1 putative transcriptional regulator [Frankia sp. CcI6]EYT93919.1 putative transcriptional regulator [Frankia casuarinae]KDA43444.1 putative transcriptional regulator [Frankia sp. BMG5.23]KEZ38417.1 transcriptional regulator, HxlR family [Frankia sp. CeD]